MFKDQGSMRWFRNLDKVFTCSHDPQFYQINTFMLLAERQVPVEC